jgi:stress response protein SCP2
VANASIRIVNADGVEITRFPIWLRMPRPENRDGVRELYANNGEWFRAVGQFMLAA